MSADCEAETDISNIQRKLSSGLSQHNHKNIPQKYQNFHCNFLENFHLFGRNNHKKSSEIAEGLIKPHNAALIILNYIISKV